MLDFAGHKRAVLVKQRDRKVLWRRLLLLGGVLVRDDIDACGSSMLEVGRLSFVTRGVAAILASLEAVRLDHGAADDRDGCLRPETLDLSLITAVLLILKLIFNTLTFILIFLRRRETGHLLHINHVVQVGNSRLHK